MSYANENKSNISKNKFDYYDEDENVFVIFTKIDLEKKLHIGKQYLYVLHSKNLLKLI